MRRPVDRLVVVSNRVSPPDGKPAAGGLAVALEAALRESGGLWFGWSGRIVDDSVGSANLVEKDGVTYATIDLDAESHRDYYNGYANQTLWPLFHYRTDLAIFDRSFYDGYHKVNQLFAQHLAPLLKPRDLVWVHDYHLIPLGEELRRLGCKVRLGFFLHTPFPVPQVLAILFNHKRLVRSLLAYDLVGFQTPSDLKAFKDYIVEELRGGRVSDDGVARAYDQSVRADVFPIGTEPDDFSASAASPEAQRYGRRMRRSLGGRALIIGVDRLDYTKGLPQRLNAVKELLERHPEDCGRMTFLQIASPSRSDVPQYMDIRQELEGIIGQINGRFAELDWVPVRYLHKVYSQRILAGLYRIGRIGLVTPLRDGMNLVAKEYVAAQDPSDPGVLVLSRFAGAAHQMTGALIVNPHDTYEVSEALHHALGMPQEERIARWSGMMENLRRSSLAIWRESFVSALASVEAAPS